MAAKKTYPVPGRSPKDMRTELEKPRDLTSPIRKPIQVRPKAEAKETPQEIALRLHTEKAMKKLHDICTLLKAHAGDAAWEESMGSRVIKEAGALVEELSAIAPNIKNIELFKSADLELSSTKNVMSDLRSTVMTDKFAASLDAFATPSKTSAITESARTRWARQSINDLSAGQVSDSAIKRINERVSSPDYTPPSS